MQSDSNHISIKIALLAIAVLAIVAIACGSGDSNPPTPAPTAVPTGPQSMDAAIEYVRAYLGDKDFEGVNCLATLEDAPSVVWTAAEATDAIWTVTLRVDPLKLLYNVHTWGVGKWDGRVESFRQTC
ncbi:MAG: hypothetical protein HQ478_11270 [Chloroflexi bacterium]|nr:hypothetical protein [Chloroflexota bacterium]